jgi:hypothetical protein
MVAVVPAATEKEVVKLELETATLPVVSTSLEIKRLRDEASSAPSGTISQKSVPLLSRGGAASFSFGEAVEVSALLSAILDEGVAGVAPRLIGEDTPAALAAPASETVGAQIAAMSVSARSCRRGEING